MRIRMCWLKTTCSVIRTYDNQDEVFVFFDSHSSIVSRTFEKNKWKVTTPSGNNSILFFVHQFISPYLQNQGFKSVSGCGER